MGRFFWIMMGAMGLLLIVLIASGDTGTTLGFETNNFASAAVAGLWALLIGTGLFGGRGQLGQSIKQLSIWVMIILALMAFYVFRFDIQDFGARLSGGLLPGSPISRTNDKGRTAVTLIRADNGHFEADTLVNGEDVRFLVDTGASGIVLSAADARVVGIDLQTLSFTILTQTANGTGRSARAQIESLDLGGITRKGLSVFVAEPGRLGQSLLGQQFLESLSSYEKRGDRLTLRD